MELLPQTTMEATAQDAPSNSPSASLLVGRDLEPWRAILAAAYRAERPDLEMGDMTALVIQGLVRSAVSAVSAGNAVRKEIPRALTLTTSSITRACKALVDELDMDSEHVNLRRVGRVLGKMRWRAERTERAKAWAINLCRTAALDTGVRGRMA